MPRERPILAARKELDSIVGVLEERVAQAKSEIWISGHDLTYAAKSSSGYLAEALKRGVSVRLLAVDHARSETAEMIWRIDPRFDSAGDFYREMKATVETVRGLQKHGKIRLRLLPILPAVLYFITDPGEPSETVKLEINSCKPWGLINSRPHLVIGSELPEWRKYFIDQFKNYWEMARDEI